MFTLEDRARWRYEVAARKHGLHHGMGMLLGEYVDMRINALTNVELLRLISEEWKEEISGDEE